MNAERQRLVREMDPEWIDSCEIAQRHNYMRVLRDSKVLKLSPDLVAQTPRQVRRLDTKLFMAKVWMCSLLREQAE